MGDEMEFGAEDVDDDHDEGNIDKDEVEMLTNSPWVTEEDRLEGTDDTSLLT